ncbi:unnamed protein product [Polarella glacialis]|uniref:Tyrosine-specific transport protein n=1 Tax=Polarella glacialis TaxID=89957 RepID=A0A813GK41_POLGL|nr:unnamed protein product [Polarella glacialis]
MSAWPAVPLVAGEAWPAASPAKRLPFSELRGSSSSSSSLRSKIRRSSSQPSGGVSLSADAALRSKQQHQQQRRQRRQQQQLAGLLVGCSALARKRLGSAALARRRLQLSAAAGEQLSGEPRGLRSGSLRGSLFLFQIPLTLPTVFPASLAGLLPKHSVVLAELAAESGGGFAAFDFEPRQKDSLGSALRLLSGGSVPGRFGAREMRQLPSGAVRVGLLKEDASVEQVAGAIALNARFDSNLSLSSNDCNTYARSVLELLLNQPSSPTGQRLYSTLDADVMDEGSQLVYKEPSLIGAIVLVAGTTVGAGILALPAVTQKVGFLPSSGALFLCWLYMATTGLLIAEVALADMASSGKQATSLQSMASRTIGPIGAFVSSASFVIVHFGLLVAYISKGGELLAEVFGGASAAAPGPVLFAAVFGGLVFATKGSDTLELLNNAFAAVVLVSFFLLVSLALPLVEPSRLFDVADWSSTSDIVPTLLLSLVYHNVVPTICAKLEGDRGKISLAIVVGSFLPFLMFLIWNGVILAAVPPGGSADPLDALRASQGSGLLGLGVLAFSLSAIVTSFIGFVIALTDFFADVLGDGSSSSDTGSARNLNRVRDFALTLLPPLALACYDPSLFFQAIDKAGAFGVSMLFGFLPAWMALMQRASELPVLVRSPGFLGGYERAPLAPGGVAVLVVVGGGALALVAENALELLTGG